MLRNGSLKLCFSKILKCRYCPDVEDRSNIIFAVLTAVRQDQCHLLIMESILVSSRTARMRPCAPLLYHWQIARTGQMKKLPQDVNLGILLLVALTSCSSKETCGLRNAAHIRTFINPAGSHVSRDVITFILHPRKCLTFK